jgi:simple sugar transport system ATP-binding protein
MQMVGEQLEPGSPGTEAGSYRVSAGRREAGMEPVLEVQHLVVADDQGALSVRDVSFTVHQGETVGLAGVEGNGQRELVQALVGLREPLGGSICLRGQPVEQSSVRTRRRLGLNYISEDRDQEGASLDASLADNLIAVDYDRPPLSRAGQLRRGAIRRFAQDILRRFDVRGGGPEAVARSLSGGNLQRLVVGREMHDAPVVLVASHPTRGVDVRGIAFIHDQLEAARSRGTAILLVSEELSELMELCDRLLVMFDGRVVAALATREVTPERLGALMTGAAA